MGTHFDILSVTRLEAAHPRAGLLDLYIQIPCQRILSLAGKLERVLKCKLFFFNKI